MTVSISGTGGVTFPDNSVQTTASKVGMTNRIINGAMVIDQRNAGASVTPVDAQFITDRFNIRLTQASKLTAQQNAGAVTPPAGFTNYLGVTSSSAYSVLSTDNFNIVQIVEGYNIADLGWGTASAATVTLSFWVRSSLTGTFGGALTNSALNRSYPFTYSIPVANTWTQITVTVAGDTSGTWSTTNGQGIRVWFGLGVGSSTSGTAGSWSANYYNSATGATSVVGTSGATFYITGVQLEKGSTATSFDYRPYGTELQLAQRYFTKSFAVDTVPSNLGTGAINTTCTAFSSGGAYVAGIFPYPATMRAIPTVVFYSGGNSGGSGVWDIYQGVWSATNATTLNIPSSTHLNLYVGSSGMTTWSSYLVAGAFTASAEL
jgi:hypothetical protein